MYKISRLCFGLVITIYASLGLGLAPSKEESQIKGLETKKAENTISAEDQALMDYGRALECLRENRQDEAIQILSLNIHRAPLHLPSRLELARLYLKQNCDSKAQTILEEGLKYSENHPEILKLLAVILEKKGELEAALDQLNKIPFHLKNDKNTVALLGHIYQGMGSFSLAGQQYTRLLQTEPNNPSWILGLAIALDGEGDRHAALENYQKLQTKAGVNTEILKYVEERIKALKKQ